MDRVSSFFPGRKKTAVAVDYLFRRKKKAAAGYASFKAQIVSPYKTLDVSINTGTNILEFTTDAPPPPATTEFKAGAALSDRPETASAYATKTIHKAVPLTAVRMDDPELVPHISERHVAGTDGGITINLREGWSAKFAPSDKTNKIIVAPIAGGARDKFLAELLAAVTAATGLEPGQMKVGGGRKSRRRKSRRKKKKKKKKSKKRTRRTRTKKR